MFYILVEAVTYLVSFVCLIVLIIVVVLVVRNQRLNDEAQQEENQRISNLVRQIDFLHIGGDQIPQDEA